MPSMNTLRYSSLLLLLLVSLSLTAQNDSVFSPRLRLGADISGLARYYFEPEIIAWELAADYEWRENWFVAAESGALHIDILRETHNYRAQGAFFRLGMDYNVLQNDILNDLGIVIVSARYGFGQLSQEAPTILISMPNWDPFTTDLSKEPFYAHWLDIGGGIKTRLFGQVYMGWNLRIRFMMHQTPSPGMDPYMISGFGKNTGKAPVMVHYYLYYRI
jgi:hypothetical protein